LRAIAALTVAAMGMSVISCSDDKTTSPEPTPSPYRNLTLSMDSMDPHVGQMMEFSVASAETLFSRAVLDPLPAAQFDFTIKQALPEQVLRLDFSRISMVTAIIIRHPPITPGGLFCPIRGTFQSISRTIRILPISTIRRHPIRVRNSGPHSRAFPRTSASSLN